MSLASGIVRLCERKKLRRQWTATQKFPSSFVLTLSGYPGTIAKTSEVPAFSPFSQYLRNLHSQFKSKKQETAEKWNKIHTCSCLITDFTDGHEHFTMTWHIAEDFLFFNFHPGIVEYCYTEYISIIIDSLFLYFQPGKTLISNEQL
ncbi:hypothetical protein OIU78_001565 [Salix suchowensis]|nr:hypothetical protein OIU78_001565 [Salix suchowensis]